MDQINEYIENKENIENIICKANFCLGEKAIRNFNGYCKNCFINLYPNHPITIQSSCNTKEQVVRKFININFDGFVHNKPIWTGNCNCTHRRKIDHRKLIGNTLLCIETDEKQHKGYKKKYDDFGNLDEEIRYDDIAMIHGGKFIFIRFNPDKFTNYKGVKMNPILYLRLSKLKNEIEKQIERIINDENEDLIEIIYLYYDNYNDEDINFDKQQNIKNNKNFNIKDEIIYNNLMEINNKNGIFYKKFMCYRCFYTSKKSNVQNHLFKKNNICKKNSLCIISNEDINELNKNQFSNNFKLFKNDLNKIITNIITKFKYYKFNNQHKYIFNCYKCFFGTNSKSSFLNHFNNGINCIKHIHNTYNYEEIENLNIFQINNIHDINKKYLLNNIIKFNDELDINNLKEYQCFRCGYRSTKSNIQNHFEQNTNCKREITCPYTDIEIKILNEQQFINNIQNQNITNNITIKFDNLIEFSKDWDISHINEYELLKILFNPSKFTNFHEKILKNINNNNVVINDDSTGFVCTNQDNKKDYKEYKLDEIIENIMDKIHKQLKNISEALQKDFNDQDIIKVFEQTNYNLDIKYNDFNESDATKLNVNKLFSKILNDNKNTAMEFLIDKNKNDKLYEGY